MNTRMTAVALMAAAGLAAACGSGSNNQGSAPAQGQASPIAQVATSASVASTPAATSAAALATPATNPVSRVNGTVASIDGNKVTLKEGEAFTVSPQTTYSKLAPIAASDIQSGYIVAVTAKRQADNTLLASIVRVLPTAPGSSFYGQSPLAGGNLMTNATVDKINGSSFSVTFPGGSDQVSLAPDATLAKVVSGAMSDLKSGSTVAASVRDGAAQSVSIQ